MLSVSINAIKSHAVSEDGTAISVVLDAKHVGELSLLMSADRCDELLLALNRVKSAIQAKRGKKSDQVTVSMPKNWLVSADIHGREVVVLVFNHQTDAQTGYALDANSAKQLAMGLVKNADAVLNHKATKSNS